MCNMSIAISFLDILPGHHMFTHLVELTSLLALTLENLVETHELLCTLSLVKKMVKSLLKASGPALSWTLFQFP